MLIMKNEIFTNGQIFAVVHSKSGAGSRTKRSAEDKAQQNTCLYNAHPPSTGPEWVAQPHEKDWHVPRSQHSRAPVKKHKTKIVVRFGTSFRPIERQVASSITETWQQGDPREGKRARHRSLAGVS